MLNVCGVETLSMNKPYDGITIGPSVCVLANWTIEHTVRSFIFKKVVLLKDVPGTDFFPSVLANNDCFVLARHVYSSSVRNKRQIETPNV